jgi:hypothetical protein
LNVWECAFPIGSGLRLAEHDYSCAVRTPDYFVLCHEQVDTFSGNIHKAAPTTVGWCFALLLFNAHDRLAVISFGDTSEYFQ